MRCDCVCVTSCAEVSVAPTVFIFHVIKVLVRREDGGNVFIQNICLCLEN